MATQKPYATGLRTIDSITSNSAHVIRNSFTGGSDYRPTIWYVCWSTQSFIDDFNNPPNTPTKSVPADDIDTTITGLARNTFYYIRSKNSNSAGSNGFGPTLTFQTAAELPSAPGPFYLDAQGQTGMHYLAHTSGDDGGTPIREYQVSWSTGGDPNGGSMQGGLGSSGGNIDFFINGLSRYTYYNVWSRARNDVGWGPWSSAMGVRTHAYVPAPPTIYNLDSVTQTSVHLQFYGNDDGGAGVQEWQIGYGQDPNNVQYTVGSGGDSTIGNLPPYSTWYFWARGRNEEGWSGWSNRVYARTQAGAKVRLDGTWRDAIPYVKENGVWRLARPFVKRVGLWKTTE